MGNVACPSYTLQTNQKGSIISMVECSQKKINGINNNKLAHITGANFNSGLKSRVITMSAHLGNIVTFYQNMNIKLW